ncbi:hypothetical protein FXF03_10910 [Vibrio cholerae]|uniref:Uncharacterized protein n=1 Tax=Vibrio cholerae TaxID=666 RepID=A0ABD7SK04_VIBCL|nr:hypothetical protein FXF03_10910 [Vibrio cholerae]
MKSHALGIAACLCEPVNFVRRVSYFLFVRTKKTSTIPCNVKKNISATQKNRPVNRLPQFFVQFSIDNTG